MWQKVKAKVLPPKPPPVHCLTLDERALIEAEDEELKKLPKLARQLFRQYVSPMKDAVKDHTSAGWSPHLNKPIYGLALVVILGCALYVFLFTIQINKCGGCERHNDMFHDPSTKLPRWANTTWAIDENLCRKPAGGRSGLRALRPGLVSGGAAAMFGPAQEEAGRRALPRELPRRARDLPAHVGALLRAQRRQ